VPIEAAHEVNVRPSGRRTPVIALAFIGSLWTAVALISFGTAAHLGWSANLYTLASDTFPRRAVGSIVGLGGLGGAIGGMLVAPAVGYWLDFSHGAYRPLFLRRNGVFDRPGCHSDDGAPVGTD